MRSNLESVKNKLNDLTGKMYGKLLIYKYGILNKN